MNPIQTSFKDQRIAIPLTNSPQTLPSLAPPNTPCKNIKVIDIEQCHTQLNSFMRCEELYDDVMKEYSLNQENKVKQFYIPKDTESTHTSVINLRKFHKRTSSNENTMNQMTSILLKRKSNEKV